MVTSTGHLEWPIVSVLLTPPSVICVNCSSFEFSGIPFLVGKQANRLMYVKLYFQYYNFD